MVGGEAGWIDLPVYEEDLPWLDDDGASPEPWGPGEIQAVFGELAPLADMYRTPRSGPDIVELYERLVGLMTTPVVLNDGINAMAIYSEHHRDEAREEMKAIIGRLAEGFERLAVSRRDSGGGSANA